MNVLILINTLYLDTRLTAGLAHTAYETIREEYQEQFYRWVAVKNYLG